MGNGIVIDRIPYSEEIEVASTIPVIAEDLLRDRLNVAYEYDNCVTFGLISCMPSLDMSSTGPSELQYSFGPSGYKAAVDMKSKELAAWKVALEANLGINVNLVCLVADTEARVKSDGLLFPSGKDAISMVTDKVIKRVEKNFPGVVAPRSSVFPVSDSIYRQNFRSTFLGIYNEIVSTDPLNNIRVLSRLAPLLGLGLDYEFSLKRAIRDLALQDAEYAMEGLWIARRSGWTGLLIIDNYPISAAQRTCRLLDEGELPIIFPVNYDKL